MSQTKVSCGQLVAAYVHDGMGRRVIVAAPERNVAYTPITLATNQRELKQAIAALRGLCEELPP